MLLRKKMLLIVNPIAGKMRAQSFDFPAFFPEHEVTLYYTKDGISTEKYVESHAPAYDTIVCAGGDGTLNHVINGLMQLKTRPPLGYIPCGTTNDFATGLGIPRDIPRAAAAISNGKPMSLDIGSFGSRHFTYVASFGAFTDSSYKAPQESKNKIGHMAYIFEAMRDIANIRPCTLTVETDNGTYHGDYVFGAVSNATSLGGMLRLSEKDVQYDDGLFEVMLISMPRSAFDFQQVVFSLLRRQYNPDYITFFKMRHAIFSMDQMIPWSLDGEYESGGNIIEIQNNPRAITLLL